MCAEVFLKTFKWRFLAFHAQCITFDIKGQGTANKPVSIYVHTFEIKRLTLRWELPQGLHDVFIQRFNHVADISATFNPFTQNVFGVADNLAATFGFKGLAASQTSQPYLQFFI